MSDREPELRFEYVEPVFYPCDYVVEREGVVCRETGEVIDSVYAYQSDSSQPLDFRRPRSLVDSTVLKLFGNDDRELRRVLALLSELGLQRRRGNIVAVYAALKGMSEQEYVRLCRSLNLTANTSRYREVAARLAGRSAVSATVLQGGPDFDRWVERVFGGYEHILDFDVMLSLLGAWNELVEYVVEVVTLVAEGLAERYGIGTRRLPDEALEILEDVAESILDILPDEFNDVARRRYGNRLREVAGYVTQCRRQPSGALACRLVSENYERLFWELVDAALEVLLRRAVPEIEYALAVGTR